MKVDLSDCVAVVTGASKNIGKSIAKAYAKNGANIAILDIDKLNGEKTVQEIEELNQKALYIQTDVSQIESVEKAIQTVINQFGRIDILVNNAGINVGKEGRKPVFDFSTEDYKKIVSIDLDGVFNCSKIVAKEMVKQNKGKIINIGSIVGLVPLRLQCAFAAAKAGVFNFTKATALELAPHNILVNAIAPGSILMEGTQELFYSNPELGEKLLSHIPLHKPGKAEDIANAALFLADKGSNYITGSIIVVDGGWTCGYIRDF
jgi:3-oxoacyl-[acyl-carrier protein] reductase